MSRQRTGVILISALGLLISALLVRPAHAITAPKFVAEERYASIVVDGDTGRVLAASNADHSLAPASLTKIMTLYMAFDAVKQGHLKLKQALPVSAHAASMTPTELGLRTGETLTAEQAILGLVTRSANDAAVVLAEALGGTEADFARKMTERAFELGMDQTNFANASGLPNPRQVSSARDMALLAMAMLRDHRAEYRYFSTFKFTYRGRAYYNHNRLLGLYKGTDGVKTGYTHDSGYNLVASALRDGRRVIGVVFGGSSGRARDAHMMTLLDDGFRSLGTRPSKPADPDEILEASAKKPLNLAATAAFDFKPIEVLKPTEVRVAAAAPAETARKLGESSRPSARKPAARQAPSRPAAPSKGQEVQVRAASPSRG